MRGVLGARGCSMVAPRSPSGGRSRGRTGAARAEREVLSGSRTAAVAAAGREDRLRARGHWTGMGARDAVRVPHRRRRAGPASRPAAGSQAVRGSGSDGRPHGTVDSGPDEGVHADRRRRDHRAALRRTGPEGRARAHCVRLDRRSRRRARARSRRVRCRFASSSTCSSACSVSSSSIGAELATAPENRRKLTAGTTLTTAEMVEALEPIIDTSTGRFDARHRVRASGREPARCRARSRSHDRAAGRARVRHGHHRRLARAPTVK